MLNPIFLEIANGTLAVGGFMLLAVIARYLHSSSSTRPGKLVARAMAAFILGDVIIRSWVWLWRHQVNVGVDTIWMTKWPVPGVGLIVSMVGIFCMVKVLSGSHAPAWIWLGIVVLTIAVMGFLAVM